MTMTTMTSDRQQAAQQDTVDLSIAEAEAALQAAREEAAQRQFNRLHWPARRRQAIEDGDGCTLVALRPLMAEADDLALCADIAAVRAEVTLAETRLRAHTRGALAAAVRLMDFAKRQEQEATTADEIFTAGRTREGAASAIGDAMTHERALNQAVSAAHIKLRGLVGAALAKEENRS